MSKFVDFLLFLFFIISAQEGCAGIKKYLKHAITLFGEKEAAREKSTLAWTDFNHERVPRTLQYRRVRVRWYQDEIHYGPRLMIKHKDIVAYTTTVDQRRTKIRSSMSFQRDVTHKNLFNVWTSDGKEIVTERLFTTGLKGILETKVNTEESYAHEVETNIQITETETLSVRTEVPLAARSVTKITWIIKEDEVEMKWTVATHISGYFAICLRDSKNNENIKVFPVSALSRVDPRLKVPSDTEIVQVCHGTMKSVKATGSYIRVNETFPNSRRKTSRSTPKPRPE